MKSALTGINIGAQGSNMLVEGTPQPIELWIANTPPGEDPEPPKNFSLSVQPSGEQWAYHTINMKNDSLRAYINLTVPNVTITVYLRKEKQPTPEKYEFRWNIPDNSSCFWKNETAHVGEILNLLWVDEEEYSCLYDPNVIFISDSEELHGKYILGLLLSILTWNFTDYIVLQQDNWL